MPVDLRGKFSTSQSEVEKIVKDEIKHPHYQIAIDRAKTFNTWFEAETDDYVAIDGDLFKDKSYIIRRSSIESAADYKHKLERMRLFPLEAKFLSSQKRIYDENNVNRQYAPSTTGLWRWLENNFDDQGSSITEFYRDKVMFVKEVLGFGAVVTDLLTGDDGKTILDDDGEVVPYNYVLRPHEVMNFQVKQGQLTLLVARQVFFDLERERKYRWTAYTPDTIWVWEQKKGSAAKELVKTIPNAFGEVPATLIRGEVDSTSSFNIGKPRRYSLKGLYLAASELFYDLQQGSELFGHPIPALSESLAKAMAGVKDDEDYSASKIKEAVGMTVVYPDDVDPPSTMFYQADMQGLQHLRDVIFKDLMSLIFNLAQVRDKSVVKSNVSGDAKFLDNVEEQGLLAQTAMDMESIENEVMRRMAMVRDENPEDFLVTYSKHYDLSSAGEIWADITEGLQYKGMNFTTMKYLLKEYLRKRSAPQEVIDEIMEELNDFGMPKQPSDIKDLEGIVPQEDLARMAQPHKAEADFTEFTRQDKRDTQNLQVED